MLWWVQKIRTISQPVRLLCTYERVQLYVDAHISDDDADILLIERCQGDVGDCGDHLVQTAHAVAPHNAVISSLPPRNSPTITNNPIILLPDKAAMAEAHYSYTVVKRLRVTEELRIGCDAAEVELHELRIDADGQGAVLHQRGGNLILVGADPCP